MKALRDYFTRDRIFTWALIILAVSLALSGEAAGCLLCFVLLELRDINEALEGKE